MKPIRVAWGEFPAVVISSAESAVKQHADYLAAKAGDADAALRLVAATLSDAAVQALSAQSTGLRPLLVSAHAEEETGRNAIPQALAAELGRRLGWPVDDAVVQANIVNHTGAGGFARLSRPALFSGAVVQIGSAVLVDDFIGQGGTLANLRGHVQAQGVKVLGAFALTGKPHSARLVVTPARLQSLRLKHEALEHWWQHKYGYGFDCLTESEARYLENSEDADHIRDRITAAEQEADSRAGDSAGGVVPVSGYDSKGAA